MQEDKIPYNFYFLTFSSPVLKPFGVQRYLKTCSYYLPPKKKKIRYFSLKTWNGLSVFLSSIFQSFQVLPVLHLAVRDIKDQDLIPQWLDIRWYPRNDFCHASLATIAAIEGYEHCSQVIFGPVCEYGLAAVGRISKFLGYSGTPLLTVGGLSFDFQKPKMQCDDEYFMNIRVGTLAFKDISGFLVSMIKR